MTTVIAKEISVNGKLLKPYSEMTAQEKLYESYEGRWMYREIRDEGEIMSPEQAIEDFYLRIILKAQQMKLPKNIDDLYRDQAYFFRDIFIGSHRREFFAAYTPNGIRNIDSYFCYKIKEIKSLKEAFEIEEQLVYCPHLHIKIKENLAENLANVFLKFSGE